jgi:hypothetical protein
MSTPERSRFGRFANLSWRAYRALMIGPVLLAGMTGVIAGLVLAPAEASKEFYSSVAGVIPVLLLTLAVQARFFQLQTTEFIAVIAQTVSLAADLDRDRDRDQRFKYLENWVQTWRSWSRLFERTVVGVALLGLLLVAEFAALHPLGTGKPDDGNPQVIYVALASGFLMIGGLAVIGGIEARVPPQGREAPDDRRGAT